MGFVAKKWPKSVETSKKLSFFQWVLSPEKMAKICWNIWKAVIFFKRVRRHKNGPNSLKHLKTVNFFQWVLSLEKCPKSGETSENCQSFSMGFVARKMASICWNIWKLSIIFQWVLSQDWLKYVETSEKLSIFVNGFCSQKNGQNLWKHLKNCQFFQLVLLP